MAARNDCGVVWNEWFLWQYCRYTEQVLHSSLKLASVIVYVALMSYSGYYASGRVWVITATMLLHKLHHHGNIGQACEQGRLESHGLCHDAVSCRTLLRHLLYPTSTHLLYLTSPNLLYPALPQYSQRSPSLQSSPHFRSCSNPLCTTLMFSNRLLPNYITCSLDHYSQLSIIPHHCMHDTIKSVSQPLAASPLYSVAHLRRMLTIYFNSPSAIK